MSAHKRHPLFENRRISGDSFDLERLEFDESVSHDLCDEAIIFYIVGYIAKCLSKEQKCIDCVEVTSPGRIPVQRVRDRKGPQGTQDYGERDKYSSEDEDKT